MIVGTDGKPLKQIRHANAVVFISQDLETWQPVKPFNVPKWVQDDDVMAYMMNGEVVCQNEVAPFYKAQVLEKLQ